MAGMISRNPAACREYYRDEESLQVLGPGKHDVIAFELNSRAAGKPSIPIA
jgi:hypothetical protein